MYDRSYVYDTESTLYYLQSRYYDPEMGRFISADAYASTGQGVLGNNMFAYCNNSPTNYVDSSGNLPVWVISGVIGAVTNTTCAAIGGERGWDLAWAAVKGFASGANATLGHLISAVDAIITAGEYTLETGNAFFGTLAGLTSYGASLFTGENVSSLPGVMNMDEAAELFFDATFSYLNSVFNTIFWEEASLSPEVQRKNEMTYRPTGAYSSSSVGPGAYAGAA